MRLLFILMGVLFPLTTFCQDYYLFIGSYTRKLSKGIYVYRFNTATGKLEYISNTNNIIANPSYLAIAPNRRFVYACTETRTANAGSVSAFSFDEHSGQLQFINKQPSGGDNPVYLTVDNTNKWVVNGNYTGGSLSVFPISDDGSLGPCRQLIQHTGKGLLEDRQEGAHVHATVLSPEQDHLFVPDLGADKIVNYEFNAGAYYPIDTNTARTTAAVPGSGPRHFTFHPNGRYAYCIEELSGTIAAYTYSKGTMSPIQRQSTYQVKKLPYNSADIHVSPDGKFLYASNRNRENTITICAVNDTDGTLTIVGYQSTFGEEPRNFIIEPGGNFLLVANQTTGNVVVFRRDSRTGLLKKTGTAIKIHEPSCLQLLKM